MSLLLTDRASELCTVSASNPYPRVYIYTSSELCTERALYLYPIYIYVSTSLSICIAVFIASVFVRGLSQALSCQNRLIGNDYIQFQSFVPRASCPHISFSMVNQGCFGRAEPWVMGFWSIAVPKALLAASFQTFHKEKQWRLGQRNGTL